MRTLCWLFSAALCCLPALAQEQHHHQLTTQEVGSVRFATSCAKSVESDFNRSVALLHSFQYEQARDAFNAVFAKDPTCAMAQWGVAMSNYHGLWGNSDVAQGRAAMEKAQQVAASAQHTTAREKAYLNALAEVYTGEGDAAARGQAFERKMATVQKAYPSDTEAAIFHALALRIAAPATDQTFANQRKCGEILEPIFARYPHHPGVAHYLIHCYDNPVLAERALPAARAYAKIAPASAHAHHMPSHIFTRVGLWQESIASNINSARIAAAAEATSKDGEARDQRLHAYDYLEYAYLQSGQVGKAKGVIEEMNSLPPLPGLTPVGNYAAAAVPARYSMELSHWNDAAALQVDGSAAPWTQAITWMAVGIGSARSNNRERAAEAEKNLAALRDRTHEMKNTYWANQVEVQRREVAAWMAQAAGKPEGALAQMRSAAELEESMDKDSVTPGNIVPAREMLAQMLQLQQQPKQALAEYAEVLKVAPNRFNALYGAAACAEAAGDAATAAAYYGKLLKVAVGDERPEVTTARQKTTIARK